MTDLTPPSAARPGAEPVAVHLALIRYAPSVPDPRAAGWEVLENLDNPRPDWFEYWPIRRRLLEEPLDDTAFYGFFSPKFESKTSLGAAAVTAFVRQHAASADVMLFSPQPDMGAHFLNVFEQNELFDPGSTAAYQALLDASGPPGPRLAGLLMDSRHICFSNYFVARPAFWRAWLALNERLFAVCEGPPSDLQRALTHETTYPGPGGRGVQRKVFLQERAASLLLATDARWRAVAHDPFGMAWSMSRLRQRPLDALAADALKRAWRDTGWPGYRASYAAMRAQLAKAA